jgi:hypothetical protein
VSEYVLRVKSPWWYVVRESDGEVVLRTTDAVAAKRFLAELGRKRPIERTGRADSPGEA